MSLESQIAELVSATNNLITTFNGKKTAIDQAVTAAITAIPSLSKTWYVDQVVGLDTNDGTRATPFKTINKAIASTPAGGLCTVHLLSDYVVDSHIGVGAAFLVINGADVVRKLQPKYFNVTDSGGSTATYLGGFLMTSFDRNIEVRSCTIELPSAAGVIPAPSGGRATAFFKTNGVSALPPIASVALNAVNVTMAADFVGALVGVSASAVVLECVNATFPSGFGGKYIAGVASGTAPSTLANVLTNLSSL